MECLHIIKENFPSKVKPCVKIGRNRALFVKWVGEGMEKEGRVGNIEETYIAVKNIAIINEETRNEQNRDGRCTICVGEVLP